MVDRVRIYRNLHKGTLSVKDWDRQSDTYGRVIARPNVFMLDYPRFIVSKAGRDRVLREKRKNVHAFVQGHPYSGKKEAVTEHKGFEVFYNPYKSEWFVDKDGNPVHQADWALITAYETAYCIIAGNYPVKS